MPIHNMVGGGGGLNLKVVGGTAQPSSPAENTIWVNTSTAISSYVFSANAPESPVSGRVWIKTAAESTTPLNVDKKNTLMVYPQTVQQYVNGAWQSKTAKIYVNGAWKDLWDGYYYKLGETYDAITGGYESVLGAKVTLNSNSMVLGPASTSSSAGNISASVNAIDVTNLTSLVFDCQANGADLCSVAVSSTKGGWNDYIAKTDVGTTRAERTVNVSNISGKVYILFRHWYNKTTGAGALTVYNIYGK